MARHLEFQENKQAELHAFCRMNGMPLTVQRTVIMAALAGRTDHPTADHIFDEVKERLPGISRTTVYRVLDTFVANGLAQKIGNTEAKTRFDARARRHHHVECIRCGAIADLEDDAGYDIELPSVPGNFAVTDYAIQFRGICAACQADPAIARGKKLN